MEKIITEFEPKDLHRTVTGWYFKKRTHYYAKEKSDTIALQGWCKWTQNYLFKQTVHVHASSQ